MHTVVIAGGSGVVGSRTVHHLLGRPEIGRVVAVGRRELAVREARLESRVVDMTNSAAIAPAIPDGTSAAFCCLGTTMKRAGSREAFRAVDFETVLAFGRAARDRGVSRFLIVSSIGASTTTRNFYLRTKGETEEALEALGFPQLTILRPSFIDDEGARPEVRTGERVALPMVRLIFSLIGRTNRYAPISADALGRALVTLAFDQPTAGLRVVQGAQLFAAAR